MPSYRPPQQRRRINRRGLFPAEPASALLITRDEGDIRTAYIAGQLEAERRRAHAPQLDAMLLDAVLWAARVPPPITASDCPRTVEVRSPVGHRRWSTPAPPARQSDDESAGPQFSGPRRGPLCHPPERPAVAIASLGATTASSLFGGAVSSHLQDEELVIDVDELYLYEAILIEV